VALSASMLQRLQEAQKGGTLGEIVGREEAGAWGNRDLASAGYDELVKAFGASDLMDPTAPSSGSPPPTPTSPETGTSVPSPGMSPGGGMTSPGVPSNPSALSMLSGASGNPPAGWMDTGGMDGGDPLGTRQFPQQGTALSRMARRTGRVY